MSKHLKRLAVPRNWSIPKKQHTWATKPSAGPHPLKNSIPLIILMRDYLNLADTAHEAKKIIANREIMVDGRVIMNRKYPIGFMDVIHIKSSKKYYRILYDVKGKIKAVEIPKENAKWKFVRIENKKIIGDKKIQLNMHDGRNIIIKKDEYQTGTVLKIQIPSQKIIDKYPMQKDNIAMIIGGRHAGKLAHITEYEIIKSFNENVIKFKEGFKTVKRNVFIVGTNEPEIIMPEVVAI